MIAETYYKGYRIEVYAERFDGAWDATVRIRRVLSDDKPHVERVTCRKMSAELVETRAAIWGRRWVDLGVGADLIPRTLEGRSGATGH
jgi:hypothetical protein